MFCISWTNPGSDQRNLSLDDYRRLGVGAAMDAIGRVCSDTKIHACGYCLGGTILAIAAAKKPEVEEVLAVDIDEGTLDELEELGGWDRVSAEDRAELTRLIGSQSQVFSIYVTARRATGSSDEFGGVRGVPLPGGWVSVTASWRPEAAP